MTGSKSWEVVEVPGEPVEDPIEVIAPSAKAWVEALTEWHRFDRRRDRELTVRLWQEALAILKLCSQPPPQGRREAAQLQQQQALAMKHLAPFLGRVIEDSLSGVLSEALLPLIQNHRPKRPELTLAKRHALLYIDAVKAGLVDDADPDLSVRVAFGLLKARTRPTERRWEAEPKWRDDLGHTAVHLPEYLWTLLAKISDAIPQLPPVEMGGDDPLIRGVAALRRLEVDSHGQMCSKWGSICRDVEFRAAMEQHFRLLVQGAGMLYQQHSKSPRVRPGQNRRREQIRGGVRK